MDGRPLSGTVGSVLDPIDELAAHGAHSAGQDRAPDISRRWWPPRASRLLELADKYRDGGTFERTLTLAWTQAQVQLRHLGISADEAHLFQKLANAGAVLRCGAAARSGRAGADGAGTVSTLWAQGISGDLPIVLARIDETDDIDIIRQLLRAHEYWRMKQLSADVVIINEKATSYVQDLQGSLEALVRGSQMRLLAGNEREPAARFSCCAET